MTDRAENGLRDRVETILGPSGRLADSVNAWEDRPQQREMALAVVDAIEQRSALAVEAATGTGKTLAYLIPAILSGRRTIVSTATRTLQDQLFDKDVPLLASLLPRPFTATVLKGRTNYLCWWQLENFRTERKFRRADDARFFPMIEAWALETETGDRTEMSELPDDYSTWSELSVGADACLGRECAHWDRCFVARARQRAAESDVVVVNHHLFFADLALRRTERAELLPPADIVVFDEAHHLEEVAASWFGLQVSSWRVAELLRDAVAFLERENAASEALRTACSAAQDGARAFFGVVARAVGPDDGRTELAPLLRGPDGAAIAQLGRALEESLQRAADVVRAAPRAGEVGARLVDRFDVVQSELSTMLHMESPDFVYLAERRGQGVFLQAVPIDVSALLRDLLHPAGRARIFASATLTTDGDFRFFARRVGLPADATTLRLEPVFDYRAQASLFVPGDGPEPSDPQFIDRNARLIRDLVMLTEGRAFVLFTSYRNMRRAWELLVDQIPYRVLLQGERSRAALLEEFRADVHSVLFATSSFWEGVDVQGEALSLVIIDKLPFASPSDPLVAARVRQIEERGGNAFAEYQVPAAAIALKQGVGRLIRHRDDVGIIALLDNRIVRKGYGARFLKSLPPLRRSASLDDLRTWWAMIGTQSRLH